MPVARRGFLRGVAAVPFAPAALALPSAPVRPGTPDAPEGVAAALAEAVKRQFGAHLDEGELEEVKKQLAEGLERAERLRKAARLRNADEPVGLFQARPRRTRGGGR